MITSKVAQFSFINTIEGYSYLALLFIAMPMKYFMDLPIAVKVVGMIHGILFIIFCLLLLKASKEAKWSFGENLTFFIASLIPFGTFFTKNKIDAYK